MVDSEDGLNFNGSVDKIGAKVCVSPIKIAVNRFILRANGLPRGVKINLYFSPYETMLDWFFAPVILRKFIEN